MPSPRKHASPANRQSAYRQRQKDAITALTRAKGIPSPASLATMPSKARWNALIQTAADLLKSLEAEMETYRDERSETWQESEKGEEFQERLDRVEEALTCVEAID